MPSADARQASFPTLILSLAANLSVSGTLTAHRVLFVKTRDVLKSLTPVSLPLVALELTAL